MSKRIRAALYTEHKIISTREGWYWESDPEGYLYSRGIYPTKILPKDLPEWYSCGYIRRGRGYVLSKGIKQLIYKPNYLFNHIHKDDILYISYGKEIEEKESDGYKWYDNYDLAVRGNIIPHIADAAEKYSDYDVTEIRKEIERKKDWFYERNPDWERH